MPDFLCQSDKMLQIVSSITHGTNAFSICPLSCDEGWSPFQCLLDVENIKNTWALHSPITNTDRASEAYLNISLAIKENQLFATIEDTMMNMFSNYNTNGLFKRDFGYAKWNEKGKPSSAQSVEEKMNELISGWNYFPPADKWDDIRKIYQKICKKNNSKPYVFE
jgi:hypothetical protein